MPTNAVYVGRPSKWGNPYRIDVEGNLEGVLGLYRKWLEEKLYRDPNFLEPLRGKDLACWCPLDKPCHADILLRYLYGRSERYLYGQPALRVK